MATNNNQNKGQLPEGIIQDIVSTEKLKINVKLEELKLRNRQLDSNEKLASKQMQFEFDLMSKEPSNSKSKLITMTMCIGGLSAVFLGFIGYMVVSNHQDFALDFLKWVGYVLGLILSFLAGRLSTKGKAHSKEEFIPSAEVVN